jgi:hypothetical protein
MMPSEEYALRTYGWSQLVLLAWTEISPGKGYLIKLVHVCAGAYM